MAGTFQPFNDLSASHFEMLKRDVEVRGIVNPILVDENDKTIDGHQRRRVAAELGIGCPRITVEGLTDDEKLSLAIALNTFRRHLTGVERSSALQKMAHLGMSTRRMAEATGLSQSTVTRELRPPESFDSGGPDGPPPGVDPETGEITASSGSGDSATAEAGGSGDDESATTPSPAPNPAPRVTGKDGKSYPASKPAQPLVDEVSKSDIGYRSATSREFSKARSGLLTLDVHRVAAICLPEDRAAYQALATDVSAWALALSTALQDDNQLRSVK